MDLSHNLKCPILHEAMNDPVSLECGHTFDRKDLERVYAETKPSLLDILMCKWYLCPTCRKQVNNYAYIKTNETIKQLQRELKLKIRECDEWRLKVVTLRDELERIEKINETIEEKSKLD